MGKYENVKVKGGEGIGKGKIMSESIMKKKIKYFMRFNIWKYFLQLRKIIYMNLYLRQEVNKYLNSNILILL